LPYAFAANSSTGASPPENVTSAPMPLESSQLQYQQFQNPGMLSAVTYGGGCCNGGGNGCGGGVGIVASSEQQQSASLHDSSGPGGRHPHDDRAGGENKNDERNGGGCAQGASGDISSGGDYEDGGGGAGGESAPLRRKRVSDMSPEERLKWSRMQSRDHSRRSRQRRKLLEQDLRTEIEQLQSFRTLIEDSYQLVSIQSIDHAATFLYANSVFFRALNYVPQELIGVPLQELAIEADRPVLAEALNRILIDDANTKPYVTVDWRILSRKPTHPGEPPIYVPVSSSISINQQGLVMFSMIKTDLSFSSSTHSQSHYPGGGGGGVVGGCGDGGCSRGDGVGSSGNHPLQNGIEVNEAVSSAFAGRLPAAEAEAANDYHTRNA